MLHPALEKRPSPIEGFGLFAKEFIPAGTIIWQQNEDDRRFTYEEYLQQPPEVQRMCHIYQDMFVQSAGDEAFMNHCCDPNTAPLGDDALVAIRDIQPDEEVTYDYITCEIDPRQPFDWECRCGAANCRGRFRALDCLDPAFQARYKGHLPSWTLAFIAAHSASNNL
jgi:SET domain-containing protein